MADPYAPEINRYSTGNDRFFGISTALAIKAPVMVYASTAITLFGEQTIGAVAIVQFDRVLVGGQADPIENGIWECREKYWKRTGDFEGNRNVVNGTVILVAEPGLPVVQYYVISAAEKVLVGETPVTFAPVPVDNPTDAASTESQMQPPVNLSDLEEAIAELQFRDPGPVADIDFPTQEVQFEQSSNNGEVLSGAPGTGHVPEASTEDATTGGGNRELARDRGKVYWSETKQGLMLRTDALANELELGKQVAFRALNISGGPLAKADIVYVSSSFGTPGVMTVGLAQAAQSGTTGYSLGGALGSSAEVFTNLKFGYAIPFGEIRGLNTKPTDVDGDTTSGGAPVFLSDLTPGGWRMKSPKLRTKLGRISNRDATDGAISFNVVDEQHYTFNACSFYITGAGGTNPPTVNKAFNVAPSALPVMTRLGIGNYRVTLDLYRFDYSANHEWKILDNLIEAWTIKSTATAPPEEWRVYVTAIDAAFKYFDFTTYKVVGGDAGAFNTLTATDIDTTEKVTFFGQMTPFTAP